MPNNAAHAMRESKPLTHGGVLSAEVNFQMASVNSRRHGSAISATETWIPKARAMAATGTGTVPSQWELRISCAVVMSRIVRGFAIRDNDRLRPTLL